MLRDTDFGGSNVSYRFKDSVKAAISKTIEKTHTKELVYALIKHEPYPDYSNPRSTGWKTMKAILCEFKKLAAEKPFIIAPLVSYSYLRYSLANTYKMRFSEECDYFFDILPYLKTLSRENSKKCFIEGDCHYSIFGHHELAKAFLKECNKAGILKQ